MSLFQAILGQYEVKAMYNIDNVDQANIVVLGEAHHSTSCKLWNGRYISYLAKKGPVALFLEGLVSMKPSVIPLSRYKEILNIDTDVPDENIQVFGWDIDIELDKGVARYQQELNEFNQKADAGLEKRNSLDTELANCKNEIQNIIPDFEFKASKELMAEWFFQLQGEEYNKFFKLIQDAAVFAVKRKQIQEELDSLLFPVPTVALETVCLRAESMAHTARSIAELQKEGKLPLKSIIIPGIAHLHPPRSDSTHALQLKPWQDEIAKHKAAILIEKDAYKDFLEKGI